MKKGCLLALLVGAALIGGIIFVAFQATKGVVKGADDFLALVGQGKLDEAYASTSAGLRKAQDRQTFERQVKTLGLDGYASSTWNSRSVENEVGKVEGTVETRSGTKVPLTMQLVKEDGTWKVLSFASRGSETKAPLPGDDEAKRLARESLVAFAEGVRTKDFTAFHGSISALWKAQASADDLKTKFESLAGSGLDFSGVKDATPVLDKPPAIDADGVLVIEGYVPGVPAGGAKTDFALKYVYEHPEWKLAGIRVRPVE